MTRRFLLCMTLCLGLLRFGRAGERMEDAVLRTRADIEEATKDLIARREEIAAQRRPLAARLEQLERDVRDLRALVQQQRATIRQAGRDRELLDETMAQRNDELRHLLDLVSEYRRGLETRMLEVESAAGSAAAVTFDALPAAADDPDPWPAAIDRVFAESLNRIERRLGGYCMDGVVLDSEGFEIGGRIAVFGPLAYFASSDESAAGIIVTRFGDAHPAVETELPEGAASAIAALARGEEAVVPVDVTGGSAIKARRARDGFLTEIHKGGVVMIPLLAVGALAALLAVWKTLDLLRLRVRAPDVWAAALRAAASGDAAESERLARSAPSPLSSLYAEGIACRKASREQLEEILHERIISLLPRLERHLGTLAVLGGIAPLLGLLGTVMGMIRTFQLVTLFGSGDARLLSGGISEALITTKYGLTIAVPVLLAHAFLTRRARGQLAALEQTAMGMVNDLKGGPTA